MKQTTTQHPYLLPEWLYDTIMEELEPDLTTYNIRGLDKKYEGETPEERTVRLEQYQAAFILYEECLNHLAMTLQDDMEETAEQIRDYVAKHMGKKSGQSSSTDK